MLNDINHNNNNNKCKCKPCQPTDLNPKLTQKKLIKPKPKLLCKYDDAYD